MKHFFRSVLVGLLVLMLVGCGGSGNTNNTSDSSPYEGKYTCYSFVIDKIEYGPGDDYIQLQKNGKASVKDVEGESKGTYTIENGILSLKLDGRELKGVIKDDLIIVDDGEGFVASFVKEGVTAPDITPKDIVNPEEFEFSYEYLYDDPLSEGQDPYVPQYWYYLGQPNSGVYVWFDGTGYMGYGEDGMEAFIIKNNHIVDKETEGEAFDFVFPDMYTAYEIVNGVTWARSNEAQLLYELSKHDWVSQDGKSIYRFYPDYTFENYFPNDDETYKGTWYMEDGNHLINTDEDGFSSRVSIFYDRDADYFEVRGLCEFDDHYFFPAE